MGRKILSILLFVCVLCPSCGDKERSGAESQQDSLLEVQYKLGTRAYIERPPTDKDTYTIISYRVKTLNDVDTAAPYEIADENKFGNYVYLEDGKGNTSFVEDYFLVPTKVSNTIDLVGDYPYRASNASDPKRDNASGQKLQEGKYKTAVIYPAAAVINSNQQPFGYRLVVLPRDINCPIYAPMPDGLFDMTVDKNMTVYDIYNDDVEEDRKLYITIAKMRACFYSVPDVDYEIASVKLLNMGTSGWFNPYRGITYPNYGDKPNEFSIIDSQTIFDPANWRESVIKNSVSGELSLGYVDYMGDGNVSYKEDEADCDVAGDHYPVHYMMDDEAIFATDYRGQSEGGTLYQYVKTIVMRITVRMPVPNANPTSYQEITADVPVSLDVKRGKLYNFYFDVRSGIFSIKYRISDWEDGNADTGYNPIGETLDYGDFDFIGGGDWIPENTGDDYHDIGGSTNP